MARGGKRVPARGFYLHRDMPRRTSTLNDERTPSALVFMSHDRIERTLHAAKGAVYALYNSGGTIPDRGYYHLRHTDTNALIGELDEEFVWEATVGQTFAFGNQSWQINRITHNDVLASPAKAGTTATPFWLAEGYDRSAHYSDRIGEFLLKHDLDISRDNLITAHAAFSGADLDLALSCPRCGAQRITGCRVLIPSDAAPLIESRAQTFGRIFRCTPPFALLFAPFYVARAGAMTSFAADADFCPARLEFIGSGIVIFAHICRVAIGAHEIPILRRSRPVQLVFVGNPLV